MHSWIKGISFLVVLAGLSAAPGSTLGATSRSDGALEEVVVTGSRVARTDLDQASAVTVLDRSAIEATGNVSLGDILQDLTVNSNGINVQTNNGGSGQTRVDLRGLGSPRTLVLVNGRRHVVGAQGTNWAVDLNAIPLGVIERVEVLKDGASAVYGSDAIAGVVNVITRDDFEGAEISVFGGRSGDNDGEVVDVNVTLGVTGDRGHMMFAAGFYEQDPVFAGNRGFSRFDKAYDWEANDGSFTTLGSTATPEGVIIDRDEGDGNALWQSLLAGNPSGAYFNDPVDGWRDFDDAGTSDVGAGDFYNYQPENYLLTPQKRWHIHASGAVTLADDVEAFLEASYLARQSSQLLASTPLFTITEGIAVSAGNFYNPFGRDFTDVRRRFVEARNRRFSQDIDTYRAVVGLKGGIPGPGKFDQWRWEAYLNYGSTQGTDINEGRFVRSRVIEAIGPSFVDESGNVRCGGAANPGSSDCVPLDLLGGAGVRPVNQVQLDWISYTGIDDLFATERSLAFNVNGPIASLPGGEVAVAFGIEHRDQEGADTPDPITNAGDTTGNKREKTAGSYEVSEVYGEVVVPVFEPLEVSLALRYSDYSNFGDTTTGKVGVIWEATDSLTLRGTYSEAFRAPTIPELFLGNADAFPSASDPCDTSQGPRSAAQQETCAADGLPDDYVDSRTQLRSIVGGNAELKPETADTYTLGLVYQPTWLDGAAVTLDYWSIELEDSIQGIGHDVILSSCYGQGVANRSLCENVSRDASGFLVTIDNRNTNIGAIEANGIDATLTFDHETGLGHLSYNLDVAYYGKYNEIQADGRVVRGVGVYDLGVYPEFKTNLSTRWQRGSWGANYNIRYTDGYTECEDQDCSGNNPRRNVDDYWQHDLQLTYTRDWPEFGSSRVTVGVQNLTNEEPPRVFNGFTAVSDETAYDFIGRYFYLAYQHTL